MINVLWFLERAEHRTHAEFRDWRLESRRRMIAAPRKPYVKHAVIDHHCDDDTWKHVSRFERLVVHEHEVPVRTDA